MSACGRRLGRWRMLENNGRETLNLGGPFAFPSFLYYYGRLFNVDTIETLQRIWRGYQQLARFLRYIPVLKIYFLEPLRCLEYIALHII